MHVAVLISTLVASVIALEGNWQPTVFSPHMRVDPNVYNHTYKHFECGTTASHASDHFLATVSSLHESDLHAAAGSAAAAASSMMHARRAAKAQFTVPLYMHIVTTAENANMVTAQQITQQVRALNNAYNPYSIYFSLKNTSWTVNDTWAVGNSADDDTAMKTALRQGTYNSLNIYLQSDLAGGVLGRCTLPSNVGTQPAASTYVSDGCNVALGTVPNGPIQGYNLGKTAVHETGHWLGLLHTFEGYSCTGSGDYIADTPVESESTDGCPTNPLKNSCPGQRSGGDPIHNYMDYSTDACYTRFTPGQQSRMQTLWKQYRAGN